MLANRVQIIRACPSRARAVSRPRAGMIQSLFGFGGAKAPSTVLAPKEAPAGQKLATFAGGCFWGLELAFQRVPGVKATSVGYTAGQKPGPSYQEVCSGSTGHSEAVQVAYDSSVTYDKLLETFFAKTDPTTPNRQGNDRGTQYRSAIYYHDEEQKAAITAKYAELNEKLQKKDPSVRGWQGSSIVAQLEPIGDYYLAEGYHQQYLEKGGQSAAKNSSDKIRCYG